MNELTITNTKELSPAELGGEIRLLTSQARRMALSFGIQIGYRLRIAHEKVGPHGWAEWLKKETEFSAAAASRFETLYENYGSDQGGIFGVENNFPTLENLSISNALRLLAVPEEERESFAAEVDAEHLSARELEKAIRERDEARKAAQEAERALQEAEDGHGLAIAELQEKLDAAIEEGQKGQAAIRRNETLTQQLVDVGNALTKAKDQIKELESRPVEVAVERDEKAIEEAVQVAKAQAAAEWAEKTKKLQDDLEKAKTREAKLKAKAESAGADADQKIAEAERETARIRQEMETLRKQVKAADANVAAFGIYFNEVQAAANKMLDKLREIDEADKETAEKLRIGARTILSKTLKLIGE